MNNDLSFYENLYRTFIQDNRYLLFLEGLQNTLLLSLFASFIGVLIGVLIALGKLSKYRPLQLLSSAYIDIIRGTPSVTQILIIYFVIFNGSDLNKIIIGSIAFGVNSGAYVAEIIRAGILSIDYGQTEAGRSLGLNEIQTLRFIVLPQAIKNILPALANEFIVLVKETAIAGYIAIFDLTKAAAAVQSRTYEYAFPLFGSAIIYYVIIKLLTLCFRKLETRLRKADAR